MATYKEKRTSEEAWDTSSEVAGLMGRTYVIHAPTRLVDEESTCNVECNMLNTVQSQPVGNISLDLSSNPVEVDSNLMLVDSAEGMTAQEALAYVRLKKFCSSIVKKLAPPLLRKVSALRQEAEPFTPKRTTRSTKRSAGTNTTKSNKVESVLLRALGLVPEDMAVDDEAVKDLQEPLREQHVRVIAALFVKCVPNNDELSREADVVIGVH
ncbi:hypothetical protein VPH35_002381 [Triticum aestivum]